MNYDIYHSSITYFPLLPLSRTVSFERKVLDIRQMPAQVLFPHWDDEFEFIYVLSGMMEFRVRHNSYSVAYGLLVIFTLLLVIQYAGILKIDLIMQEETKMIWALTPALSLLWKTKFIAFREWDQR